MITERQEKILELLVKEYLEKTQPISSKLLKERAGLDVSAATIRNDFQELMKKGFLTQPHPSGGRIPTQKAYNYIAKKIIIEQNNPHLNFIFKEIENTKREIEQEINLINKITNFFLESFEELNINNDILEVKKLKKILIKIGCTKELCKKNFKIILKIIEGIKKI